MFNYIILNHIMCFALCLMSYFHKNRSSSNGVIYLILETNTSTTVRWDQYICVPPSLSHKTTTFKFHFQYRDSSDWQHGRFAQYNSSELHSNSL